MLLGSWERLREPDSVVVDKAGYILLFPGEPLELGRTLEMNDHRVTIVGISDASAPFVSLPVMHARYSEAVNFLGRERTQLSFVIARPREGTSPAELTRRIHDADRPARADHERVHVGLHPLLPARTPASRSTSASRSAWRSSWARSSPARPSTCSRSRT